jgi:hypothetical protein
MQLLSQPNDFTPRGTTMHHFLLSNIVVIGLVAAATSPAHAQLVIVNTEGSPGLYRYHAGFYRYAPHYNEGFAVGGGAITVFATAPSPYPPPYPVFRPYYGNPYDPFGPYGYGSVPVSVWRPRTDP